MIKAFRSLILICVCSCVNGNSKHSNEVINSSGQRITSYFEDSLNYFKDVSEFHIKGSYQSQDLSIEYESVTKKEFIAAMHKNDSKIRLFSANHKINEALNTGYASRHDSILILDFNDNYFQFRDSIAHGRLRKFFFEGSIGSYFVIKELYFEDAKTNIWDIRGGNLVASFLGISSCLNNQDSILFHCNPYRTFPNDSNHFCFVKLGKNVIDTLMRQKTDWYANYSFFDFSDPCSMYYIHNTFQDMEHKSTFAKMYIRPKS